MDANNRLPPRPPPAAHQPPLADAAPAPRREPIAPHAPADRAENAQPGPAADVRPAQPEAAALQPPVLRPGPAQQVVVAQAPPQPQAEAPRWEGLRAALRWRPPAAFPIPRPAPQPNDPGRAAIEAFMAHGGLAPDERARFVEMLARPGPLDIDEVLEVVRNQLQAVNARNAGFVVQNDPRPVAVVRPQAPLLFARNNVRNDAALARAAVGAPAAQPPIAGRLQPPVDRPVQDIWAQGERAARIAWNVPALRADQNAPAWFRAVAELPADADADADGAGAGENGQNNQGQANAPRPRIRIAVNERGERFAIREVRLQGGRPVQAAGFNPILFLDGDPGAAPVHLDVRPENFFRVNVHRGDFFGMDFDAGVQAAAAMPDLNHLPPLRNPESLTEPYKTLLTQSPIANVRNSVLVKLRFFAAMEGPVQSFSVHSFGRPPVHYEASAQESEGTLQDFIAQRLVNPKTLFTLQLEEGIAVQIHGEQMVKEVTKQGERILQEHPGPFLRHVAGEFHRAFTQALEQGGGDDYKALRTLYPQLTWCFDGSVTALNDILREHNMANIDLVGLPNVDPLREPREIIFEYVRAFDATRAADFQKIKGTPAHIAEGAAKGTDAPGYDAFTTESAFRKFLVFHEAEAKFNKVGVKDFEHLVQEAVAAGMIVPDNEAPQDPDAAYNPQLPPAPKAE